MGVTASAKWWCNLTTIVLSNIFLKNDYHPLTDEMSHFDFSCYSLHLWIMIMYRIALGIHWELLYGPQTVKLDAKISLAVSASVRSTYFSMLMPHKLYLTIFRNLTSYNESKILEFTSKQKTCLGIFETLNVKKKTKLFYRFALIFVLRFAEAWWSIHWTHFEKRCLAYPINVWSIM